jgi:hypothetical protein
MVIKSQASNLLEVLTDCSELKTGARLIKWTMARHLLYIDGLTAYQKDRRRRRYL